MKVQRISQKIKKINFFPKKWTKMSKILSL
jgi:hypothetical protein